MPETIRYRLLSLGAAAAAALGAACGAETVDLDGQESPARDGGPGGGGCTPGAAECNNCSDDDGDGYVDGLDPHCAGPLDDDEATFATGIPGDNSDPKKQDCFFDGDSGGSCQIETCCLLTQEQCEAAGGAYGSWPPSDCDFDQACIDACAELTPPGCDCFGCCTICNPDTGECADILSLASPTCDPADIGTPRAMEECVTCSKFEECSGGSCQEDPRDCVLCPGETEEDLPPECNEANECPGGGTPCDTSGDCADNEYCANRCCVAVVD